MPQFRLAIGYRTEHRNSEPVVLAGAHSPEALQAAINTAPADFLRFELGVFQFVRSARRTEELSPDLRQAIAESEVDTANLIATVALLSESKEKLQAELDELRAAFRTQELTLTNTGALLKNLLAERDLLAEQIAQMELKANPPSESNVTATAVAETPVSDASPDASEAVSSEAASGDEASGPNLDKLLTESAPTGKPGRKK